MASLILDLVKQYPIETVKEMMNEKAVTVSWDGDLYIFNYGAAPDFSDPYVCEARGIIIDVVRQEIVCRGFDKFFNFSEPYAVAIDWSSAKVQEKVDGSIIKLYWYEGEWRFSTNAVINARNSHVSEVNANLGGAYHNFDELIRAAENFSDIPFDKLDKNATYIFELVSPYNHVVIHYGRILLYHTGTRDNRTGQERAQDIGIVRPQEYSFHTLDDCIDAVKKLNRSNHAVEKEGFVVVDQAFHRIKIKAPEYLFFHSKANNHVLTKERVIEMIESDDFDEKLFLEQFPEFESIFSWYTQELQRFHAECKAHALAGLEAAKARSLTAKELYAKYQDDPYSFIVMNAFNRPGKSLRQILGDIRHSKKMNLIRDYVAEGKKE